ncbi:MAG: hypothetical protein Q4D60_08325 [Eubacteriales bacterium]|nr:hypothetical protein [Eubacteriales bacterium]
MKKFLGKINVLFVLLYVGRLCGVKVVGAVCGEERRCRYSDAAGL